MADSKSKFLVRVVSALAAAIMVLSIDYFFGPRGLVFICTIAIVLGVREYSRMAFRPTDGLPYLGHIYWALCLLAFVGMFLRQDPLLVLAVVNVAFMSFTIWFTRGHITNEKLLNALALASFGMTYCVLFPYFALKIVNLENGEHWFLFLLFVVFFGDIFAYFAGRWFGERKFMPLISPNKTWAGAVGGLLGSALAGTIYLFTALGVDPWLTIPFCVICGAAAQSGDLLVSLVKRVAQVKDSGSIMPGHGGILDRLDGVYIACPLVYAFALFIS